MFAPGAELTFLPGRLPSESAFAAWAEGTHTDQVELVLPRGATGLPRRTPVPATMVPLREALPVRAALPADAATTVSQQGWSIAVKIAVDLVARGRVQPGKTARGVAAWQVGPFDAADEERLRALAAAFPATAPAPGPVLSRLGEDAETDLLLSLRRARAAWAPAERLLAEVAPDRVGLDDAEVSDLLGPAADALSGLGFEVLWPIELGFDKVKMRALVSTPSPGAVTEAGLTFEALAEFRWEVALGGMQLTEAELHQLATAKRPLVRLRGRWVLADPQLLERLRRKPPPLDPMAALAAALTGKLTLDGEQVDVVAGGALADLVERLRSADGDAARELDEPAGLKATLRPYQRRGLAWLAGMADIGFGGCLADDMGLGKTLQLIALHVHRRASGEPAPTLVVCPASLLGNWEHEIHRFAPDVPVRRYHGGDRHLDDVASDEMVLVTYGLIRRDRALLAEVAWGLVVADEAQHVKNPLARTARELRGIPARARLALTGTPVENRLTELWAILDWTTPGLLGPLERFRREVAVPVERHRDPDTTERLGRVIRPFLLRRRKSDPGIAPELPPKTTTDEFVPLTPEQATLYQAVIDESMDKIANSEGIDRRGQVLKLLTSLKQICNHPAQYLHEKAPLAGRSGKLAALDELLDSLVDAGDSALVFSQYVQLTGLVEQHLASRGGGHAVPPRSGPGPTA